MVACEGIYRIGYFATARAHRVGAYRNAKQAIRAAAESTTVELSRTSAARIRTTRDGSPRTDHNDHERRLIRELASCERLEPNQTCVLTPPASSIAFTRRNPDFGVLCDVGAIRHTARSSLTVARASTLL
jgi:hypothetical protein